jgi:hypothetical protein
MTDKISTEVHQLDTRVSVLESELKNTKAELQRVREELESQDSRSEAANEGFRLRLEKVEDVVRSLELNTALMRQAVQGIGDIKTKLDEVHAKQNEAWWKVVGAKWVLGGLFVLVVAVIESGHFFK